MLLMLVISALVMLVEPTLGMLTVAIWLECRR
jgi:hypothetical protein